MRRAMIGLFVVLISAPAKAQVLAQFTVTPMPPSEKTNGVDIGPLPCADYLMAARGLPPNTHVHAAVGGRDLFDTSLRFLDWMSGYIASYKAHAPKSAALVHDEYARIDSFLRGFCRASPKATFQSAVDMFIQNQLDNTI